MAGPSPAMTGQGPPRRQPSLPLDARGLAQAVDHLALGAARQEIADLRLDLGECRQRLLAPLLDADGVPAELGLHRRLRVLAGLEREGGGRKRADHALAREEAEIAAVVLGPRIGRVLARELLEIGA